MNECSAIQSDAMQPNAPSIISCSSINLWTTHYHQCIKTMYQWTYQWPYQSTSVSQSMSLTVHIDRRYDARRKRHRQDYEEEDEEDFKQIAVIKKAKLALNVRYRYIHPMVRDRLSINNASAWDLRGSITAVWPILFILMYIVSCTYHVPGTYFLWN